jgi:hypothetical protein
VRDKNVNKSVMCSSEDKLAVSYKGKQGRGYKVYEEVFMTAKYIWTVKAL